MEAPNRPASAASLRDLSKWIVVCGEALVDFTPIPFRREEAYRAHPGGSPYNVAIALGRLEVPVAFLGRISQDFFGGRLRQHLQDNRVDLRYLREGPEPSTLAFVHLGEGNEPRFAFYGEGTADRGLLPEHVPASFPRDICALHFGSNSLVLEPAASTLDLLMRREHGRRLVSLDPNVRPGLIADRQTYRNRLEEWLGMTDLIKLSRADLSWLYPGEVFGSIVDRWRGMGPRLVVVTLGADGAIGWGAGAEVHAPGTRVSVVDTVGAGDAFTAGLLAWLYRDRRLTREGVQHLSARHLADALGYANRVAALTCTRAGANPPYLGDMEQDDRHPA
jgi:fructokinase